MILNFRDFGSDRRRAVFFLHGLLGNAENWASTCREFAEDGSYCVAVDQRNHGASPHSPQMDYALMAEDLVRLADSLGIGQFSIVGHSMGGKTAMETALACPERVRSLVVVDIAPVQYKPEYIGYIDSLKLINLEGIKRRSEADARLEEYIPDRSLRMFFLTNLRRDDDGFFRWRINIDGITANYGNIWKAVEGGRSYNGPAMFIKGGDSGFIEEKHMALIADMFPAYRLATIKNSGHWVHTEQPKQFRMLLKEFLNTR